jgi:predicted Abi (CAAX) family protease
MNIIRSIILISMSAVLLFSCSDNSSKTPKKKISINEVVNSCGYEIIVTDESKDYFELENRDRTFYKPVSFEISRIRSLQKQDAYHGPTHGDYFLSIEVYNTPKEAQKRAEEYKDLSRLAGATDYDSNELNKKTVRCWGFSSGEIAYLLTTHAVMYSTMERESLTVMNGVKAYEQKNKADNKSQ